MLSNSVFLSSSNVEFIEQFGSWASKSSMSDINCFSTFDILLFWAVANFIVSPLICSNNISKNKSWSIVIFQIMKIVYRNCIFELFFFYNAIYKIYIFPAFQEAVIEFPQAFTLFEFVYC